MNRRERRAAGRREPRVEIRARRGVPADPAAAIACPDCDATVTIREVAPGVFDATVEHDDTCPWFSVFEDRMGR